MNQDPYETLGVSRDASADEIKSAYRTLARRYHPDVNPGDHEAEEKFKEMSQAYAVLSDPEKKARFDQYGTMEEVPSDTFFTGNFADIFDMFFGGGATTGRRRSGRNGEDLQTQVQLELRDVITGVEKEVTINRLEACPDCKGTGAEGGAEPETCAHCNGEGAISRVQSTFIGNVRTSATCPVCSGTGKIIKNPCKRCRGRQQASQQRKITVKIPPGVESGASMHLPGEGNEGIGYGRSGDLYVRLLVKPDNRFEREGIHLHTEQEVTFAQASIGDELRVPGVDEEHEVLLPAGTQPGDVITVKGAGLPPLHGGRRGDIYLHVTVKVPQKLNEAQRKLIIELAEASGEAIPKGEPTGLLGSLFKKKK